MGERENHRRMVEMEEKCIRYRGTIIHEMISLEWEMENTISLFFGKEDKWEDLYHSLIAHPNGFVTLHAKTTVLSYIIQRHFKDFADQRPNYLEKLNDLIEKRNIVAHRKFIYSDQNAESYDGKSIFIQWMRVKEGKVSEKRLELNDEVVAEISRAILEVMGDTVILREHYIKPIQKISKSTSS